MKILITGCAGFIGSHTCERLLEEGHELVGIDNFSKFYDKSIKQKNLSGFIKHPHFTFHEIDIRQKQELFSRLNMEVDVVIHLAAKAGVRPSIENIDKYIDVNVKGTHHVLDWMVANNCKKLLFASSSSVYGNQMNGEPSIEGNLDVQPISPYAFTKRAAELVNHTFHHLHDLDIINMRFFTVYGPRQRPDLAINKFVRAIDKGHLIEMYGDGTSSRDYTYIDDAVRGILMGIKYLDSNSGLYETVNIGSQRPILLKEVIDLLYKLKDKPKNVVQKDAQMGDATNTYANIGKATSMLGYQPQVKFEDGVQNFLDWFESQK